MIRGLCVGVIVLAVACSSSSGDQPIDPLATAYCEACSELSNCERLITDTLNIAARCSGRVCGTCCQYAVPGRGVLDSPIMHGANTVMETANTTTLRPTTLDAEEVERFAALASEWWDPHGKFKPLHKIGPARLTFVRDQIKAHFAIESGPAKPLRGFSILDIGCGGGLICEPLARLGGNVTGLDPALASIEAARPACRRPGPRVSPIESGLAEELVDERARTFDVVLCLEVVEHVPDVDRLRADLCASGSKPGGMMVLSTIQPHD